METISNDERFKRLLGDAYLLTSSSSHILTFSVGIVLLSLFFQLWKFSKRRETENPLPPGRFGLPLIGQTLEFLRSQRRNKSWEFFDSHVADYGEIFKTHLAGSPTVVTASPAGNKMVFTNENKLVNVSRAESVVKILGSRSLIALTGAKAKRMRQAISTFLGPEALQTYTGKADVSVRKFLEEYWEGKEQVMVYPLMKRFAFSLACEILMSRYEKQEQEMLLKPFATMMQGILNFPINLPGTRYRKAMNAANILRNQFKKWLEETRRDVDQGKVLSDRDLLTCLLTYKDDEAKLLAEQDILDSILFLLFASHDTTTVTTSMMCKLLAENPAVLEDVWREQKEIAAGKKPEEPLSWADLQRMKLSWRVVQETLRIQPPVQGAFRVAIKDFEFSGFRIPKAWKLYWTVNSTHWNPKYFPDPHKFDPSRFEGAGPLPFTFVPFGGGSRMCPGNEFARMQALALLHHLVIRFKWKLVDPGEIISVDPMPHPQKGLPIWLERRTD